MNAISFAPIFCSLSFGLKMQGQAVGVAIQSPATPLQQQVLYTNLGKNLSSVGFSLPLSNHRLDEMSPPEIAFIETSLEELIGQTLPSKPSLDVHLYASEHELQMTLYYPDSAPVVFDYGPNPTEEQIAEQISREMNPPPPPSRQTLLDDHHDADGAKLVETICHSAFPELKVSLGATAFLPGTDQIAPAEPLWDGILQSTDNIRINKPEFVGANGSIDYQLVVAKISNIVNELTDGVDPEETTRSSKSCHAQSRSKIWPDRDDPGIVWRSYYTVDVKTIGRASHAGAHGPSGSSGTRSRDILSPGGGASYYSAYDIASVDVEYVVKWHYEGVRDENNASPGSKEGSINRKSFEDPVLSRIVQALGEKI